MRVNRLQRQTPSSTGETKDKKGVCSCRLEEKDYLKVITTSCYKSTYTKFTALGRIEELRERVLEQLV